MIHNGIDYQELTSSFHISIPGDYFFYREVGRLGTPRQQWSVLSDSGNVYESSIDTEGGMQSDGYFHYYLFISVNYPDTGVIENDWVIYQNTYSQGPEIKVEFSAIVGIQTVSRMPIWKDFEITGPRISRFQYKVEKSGQEIYKGYSYLKPGETVNKFKVNEVARDYLFMAFPESLNTWTLDSDASGNFDVYVGLSSEAEPTTQIADINFYYDWSYSDYYLYQYDSWLAMEPIQNYYDSRQYQLFSVNSFATLRNSERTITYINAEDGRHSIKTQLPQGSYELFSYEAPTLLKYRFQVKDNCGVRYCLYYINSRGGWDSLLVEGNYLQTSRYTRDTFTQNYLTPSINRGTIEYRNNIKETWTLYLKGLSDSQNKLYHNLYESTNVYLHDLEEGRIVPVVITSSEMQYKTRKNQGRKLYSYEIQVESSQNKLRM